MSASQNALASLPWYQRVEGFVWNAATGTLSDAQKQALIENEASANVLASGGVVSPDSAASQARADVTTVLTGDHADPSQASFFNNPGLDALFQKAGWILAIGAVLIVLWLFFQIYKVLFQ